MENNNWKIELSYDDMLIVRTALTTFIAENPELRAQHIIRARSLRDLLTTLIEHERWKGGA